jgi:GNAT superfamily N-acetyltransferase
MLTIRKVDTTVERNRALLHWLQLEALPGDIPIETEEGHWWIAYDDSNPIGFCSIKQSSRWSDTAYLCRAGVLRAHRGKGIQKKLIRTRVNYARREGFTWLITDTFYNPASANSLIACGFKMFNPTNPWSFKDACYWRKKT